MASFDYTGHVNPNQVHYSYKVPEFDVAEFPLDDVQPEELAPEQASRKLGRVVSLLGAVGSLALVVGIGVGEHFLASDVAALIPVTQRFLFLEDGDVVELTRERVTIRNASGSEVDGACAVEGAT